LAINPMTGKKITANKENTVLTFRLTREEQTKVEQLFDGQYYVLDCSLDFTDFLALPAKVLISNPLEMDNDELNVFDEWFSDNIDNSIIILTRPFPIKANFTYQEMKVDSVYKNLVLRGLQ